MRRIRRFISVSARKIIHWIGWCDKHLTKGKLKRVLTKYLPKEDIDDEHRFFLLSNETSNFTGKSVRALTVKVPIVDLIRIQYDSEFNDRYNRYELAVRWLAVEQLDGKNDFGQDWDDKLQQHWTQDIWRERFEKLFHNIKENGYDVNSVIPVDREMQLLDGSHRMPLALYFGSEFVTIQIHNVLYGAHKGREFMIEAGFSQPQILTIESKLNEIINRCDYPFTCILWPSAFHLWEQIMADIRNYAPDNLSIIDYDDKVMSAEELNGFYKMAYALDDVPSEYLLMKRDYVFSSCDIKDDKYPVRLIRLDIKNPYYRIKPHSGLPQSKEIIRCKETLRAKYKNSVKDYHRDVIIHIADNYVQSKFIWETWHMNTDLSSLFLLLTKKKLNVAVIKRNKAYRYPIATAIQNNKMVFCEEIDLLTNEDDFSNVVESVKQWYVSSFKNDWCCVEERNLDTLNDIKHTGSVLLLLLHGQIAYQVHVQRKLYDLKPEFIDEILENKRMDNVQPVVDNPYYEAHIRLADYKYFPKKLHHREYVQHFQSLISENSIEHAFLEKSVGEVKALFEQIAKS